MLRQIPAAAVLLCALAGTSVAAQPPAAPGGTAIQEGITPTGELVRLSAGEIAGLHVYSNDGEDLGEVERVVVGQADNVPHAVVEIGGFLGFGATPVAIPFDLLRLQDQDIYINRNFAEGQLRERFPYHEARYRTIASDQLIADVIGIGDAPSAGTEQAAAVFREADLNGDGYITMSEAAGNELLSYNWREIDRDADGLVDRAEFSAFMAAPPPSSAGDAPAL